MQAILSAVAVRIEHGSQFTDGRPRVLFSVKEADQMFHELRLRVDEFEDIPALGADYNLVLAPAKQVEITA